MSYLYNRQRKTERLIQKIKDTYTIESLNNLNPEIKQHKRILDMIKEYNITLKIR